MSFGIVASVTSVALSRGASADELDQVWELMRPQGVADTPSGFIAQIDKAIADVRKRNDRKD